MLKGAERFCSNSHVLEFSTDGYASGLCRGDVRAFFDAHARHASRCR